MTFATAGFGCGAFYLFAGVGGWQVPRQLYRKNRYLIQAWYFIPSFFWPSVTLVQYLWTGKLFFYHLLRLQIRIHQMLNRMMTLLFSDILPHTHSNFIVAVQYFLSPTEDVWDLVTSDDWLCVFSGRCYTFCACYVLLRKCDDKLTSCLCGMCSELWQWG